MNIGEKIHKLRKEKNMTLLELSEKSGVALATLSRMENGRMTGTVESHVNICKALDVSIADIYKDLPGSPEKVEVQTREDGTEVFIHNKRASSEMLSGNFFTKMIKYLNERIRTMTVVDIALVKWSVLFITIIIVKLFPQLLSIDYVILVILMIACMARPFYKIWIKQLPLDFGKHS